MAAKNKLELLMELSDKLFNNALVQVQQKLSGAVDKMQTKLQSFNIKQAKIFANLGDTFNPTKIRDVGELLDEINGKLEFSKGISDTKTMLRQMEIPNVDEIAAQAHSLQKRWGDAEQDIIRGANSATKVWGTTMAENMKILENGYEKGANLNGDMIDQFKEYAPQMRELGIGANGFIAIMARAGKDGVFSDKAIDSIKEANLSLKEMNQTQIDALAGLGIQVKDLAGKTSWEAVQMIAKRMADPKVTAQARQLALTDIFKGAGEDAGMGFIMGLGSIDLDPNNLPNFKKADDGLQGFISKVETMIADKMGGVLPYLQGIAMTAVTISSVISIITTLNGLLKGTVLMTKLQTAAQWALNVAMNANPIGLVVLAIAALIAIIVVIIQKWDEWGAALTLFLGPVGLVVGAIKSIYDHWESIKKAFETGGIIGALKRLHLVLMDAVLKPVQQLLQMIAKIDPTGLAQKGVDNISRFRRENDLVTQGEKDAMNKSVQDTMADVNKRLGIDVRSTPDSLYNPARLDGKLADTGKKGKKTGEDINKVTGQTNQVRKIDIKIDSFNKGGINVTNEGGKGMTPAEVEKWFKEMMMRVILNAENA